MIHELIAEGAFAAVHSTRAVTYQGRKMQAEGMRLVRFEDGKIAELFEYADPKQWEE